MNRRQLLTASLLALVVPALPAFAQNPPVRTRWKVVASEGMDAIAFLDPLSGGELYTRFYADDLAAFAPKLPARLRADVPALWEEARKAEFGLLGPNLLNVMSGGDIETLDGVIAGLADLEGRIRPKFASSEYWDEKQWRWLTSVAPRLSAILIAMRDAGFGQF